MKTLSYTVIIEPAEEGGYLATVPTLGCVTQGETYDEAVAMAEDCIEGFLEALRKAGDPIPVEEPPLEAVRISIRVNVSSEA